jgi:hypothetical protein
MVPLRGRKFTRLAKICKLKTLNLQFGQYGMKRQATRRQHAMQSEYKPLNYNQARDFSQGISRRKTTVANLSKVGNGMEGKPFIRTIKKLLATVFTKRAGSGARGFGFDTFSKLRRNVGIGAVPLYGCGKSPPVSLKA